MNSSVLLVNRNKINRTKPTEIDGISPYGYKKHDSRITYQHSPIISNCLIFLLPIITPQQAEVSQGYNGNHLLECLQMAESEFIYVDEDNIDPDYKCSVCFQPFRQPQVHIL